MPQSLALSVLGFRRCPVIRGGLHSPGYVQYGPSRCEFSVGYHLRKALQSNGCGLTVSFVHPSRELTDTPQGLP